MVYVYVYDPYIYFKRVIMLIELINLIRLKLDFNLVGILQTGFSFSVYFNPISSVHFFSILKLVSS